MVSAAGEEKAQAKSACEEFAKALQAVQKKLEEQEKKTLSQLLSYDAKVWIMAEICIIYFTLAKYLTVHKLECKCQLTNKCVLHYRLLHGWRS